VNHRNFERILRLLATSSTSVSVTMNTLFNQPITIQDIYNNMVDKLIPGILQFIPVEESLNLIHTPFHEYRGIKLNKLHTRSFLQDRKFRSEIESRTNRGGSYIQLDQSITELQLFGESIQNIDLTEIMPYLNQLTNFTEIYVWYTSITTIPAEFLKQSMKLKKLRITYNSYLESVPDDLLIHSVNLRILYLYGNKLTRLPLLSANIDLLSIDAACNQIENIAVDAFRFNAKLINIYLYGNKISNLHVDQFEYNNQLKWVHLEDNLLGEEIKTELRNKYTSSIEELEF